MQINEINSFVQNSTKITNFNGIVKDGKQESGTTSLLYKGANDFASFTNKNGWSQEKRNKFIQAFNNLHLLSRDFDISGIFPNHDMPGCIKIKAKNHETHKDAYIAQGDYWAYKSNPNKSYTIVDKRIRPDFIRESVSGKQGIFPCSDVMDPTAFIEAAIDILPELEKSTPKICTPD